MGQRKNDSFYLPDGMCGSIHHVRVGIPISSVKKDSMQNLNCLIGSFDKTGSYIVEKQPCQAWFVRKIGHS